MKKIILTFSLLISSFLFYGQTIEYLSVSPVGVEAVDITLVVVEGYEIGYLSHSYIIDDNTIDLSVCYWFTEATIVSNIEKVIQIPIPLGNNDYTLNVETYNSITQGTCDFNELIDTATLEFSTPLTEAVILSSIEFIEELENQIHVYPNPTNRLLYVESDANLQILSISAYSITGSKLLEIDSQQRVLDLSEISAGVYLLIISTNKGNVTKQIFLK